MRWLMWALPAFLFLIAFFHRPATGAIVGLLPATYLYAYLAA
jgi:hypothetical protein